MTGKAANDLAKIAEASDGVVSPEQTLIVFRARRPAMASRRRTTSACRWPPPIARRCSKAGLVETLTREQNALWLSLTAAGWDWAGANLTKALPASFVVLHHMMVRTGEHLERTSETLRELIGDPPKPGNSCRSSEESASISPAACP